MHIWLHKIEVLIDKLVAPILAALLVIIIGEFFFAHQFEIYKHYADWFDGFVVLIFAIDLGFKYSRVRKLPTFVKKYWLEILATIPFFLVFRLMELFRLTSLVEQGQAIAHEAVGASRIEKEAAILLKDANAYDVSRTAKMINTFRAASRFPRFLKAVPFYEAPSGKHHWHEKKKTLNK
ncbi:hypothetical protein HYU18_04915 [Candidatus Woesearchaeota archaeon]|nr:hypothetical protein [Candidatus Woesearchaeota archaeon]